MDVAVVVVDAGGVNVLIAVIVLGLCGIVFMAAFGFISIKGPIGILTHLLGSFRCSSS